MKKFFLHRTLAALAASAVLLAGCGGGGGGDSSSSNNSTALSGSRQFEGGVAGCTVDTQKKFIRAYMDEVYFWYREIPEVDATKFSTVEDYFHALLVKTPDSNGLPKDRFSAVLPVSQAQAILQQSAVAQQADPTRLLAANRTDAVPKVNVFTTAGGRVTGYIQFNDHVVGAQDDLIDAFRQVQAGAAQDLVLDLRFNSGGFLYIAQSAASMITGPASESRVFEQLQYNDKRQQESAASTLFFRSAVQFSDGVGAKYAPGTPLPQLNLPRVFVLTTDDTCSASESIINSLRGVDVQVIRVGTTTCGKPYGFTQKNNCGLAYFPIEFQGTNAKGFGDYTTGFSPICEVQDSTRTVAAGSPGDPLLEGAKFYIDHGACPAGTATGVQSAATPIVTVQKAGRPAWAGRMLLPEQRP
jgi:hypothetical protein